MNRRDFVKGLALVGVGGGGVAAAALVRGAARDEPKPKTVDEFAVERSGFKEFLRSASYWSENRVTLGNTVEEFDAVFGEFLHNRDTTPGVMGDYYVDYHIEDVGTIQIVHKGGDEVVYYINIWPYNVAHSSGLNPDDRRFTATQADLLTSLFLPEDAEHGERKRYDDYGWVFDGYSRHLHGSVPSEVYEAVDPSPSYGKYMVEQSWESPYGGNLALTNGDSPYENIYLITLRLDVDEYQIEQAK